MNYVCDVKETTTLILSHYWVPIGVTSARDAITKLSRSQQMTWDKAHVKAITKDGALVCWEDWIDPGMASYYHNQPYLRSRRSVIPVPTVLLTTAKWVHKCKNKPTVKYMYKRYNGVCQICGENKPLKTMTLEHILPKCKHGTDDWFNLTMSCQSCNTKKDNIYPYYNYKGEELSAPAQWSHFHTFAKNRPEWGDYIFKNIKVPNQPKC